MDNLVRDRRLRVFALGLCLLAGIAVGVSGLSVESNHPTYLPPGLRYLNPNFLADDWWLNSSRHYHFAFFALAAVLAKLGILEVGLAGLNILMVAGALYACFRIILWLRADRPLVCLAVLTSVFLATATFVSVGQSYLFMPSLQPSSIAATATLVALLAFLERKPVRCGLWLGLAGLFHVNFLVANIPFFGLLFVLKALQDGALRSILAKRSVVELGQILGPSLLVSVALLKFILSVQADGLAPADAAQADWIFFRFAVPYHYYPLGDVLKLLEFLAWQALGMVWTARAVPDPSQRRVIWAVQLAFALILWTATALTTFVFIPSVSRLYLWRLAPFAVLVSVLLTIVGAVRIVSQDRDRREAMDVDSRILLISFAILLTLVTILEASSSSTSLMRWYPPGPMVLALALLAAALRLWGGFALPGLRYVAVPALLLLIAGTAATLPDDRGRSRYSLLHDSPAAQDQEELFAFVRSATPIHGQFLIPPGLDFFRMKAERAIVVDFKAMPINRSGLLEWYRRLAAVSGDAHPLDMQAVDRGYRRLDASRLESLRREYRLTHAVLQADQQFSASGWREIYRNASFRVIAYEPPIR